MDKFVDLSDHPDIDHAHDKLCIAAMAMSIPHSIGFTMNQDFFIDKSR